MKRLIVSLAIILIITSTAHAQSPVVEFVRVEPFPWSSVYLDTGFYWQREGESGWSASEDKTSDQLAPGYKIDVPPGACARWRRFVNHPAVVLSIRDKVCEGGWIIRGVYYFRVAGVTQATATATLTPGQTPSPTRTPTRTPVVTRTPAITRTPQPQKTPNVVCVYGDPNATRPTITWWADDVVFVVPIEWVQDTYSALDELLSKIASENE